MRNKVLTKNQFDDLVLTCCNEVARKHWKNVINANHDYIASFLA